MRKHPVSNHTCVLGSHVVFASFPISPHEATHWVHPDNDKHIKPEGVRIFPCKSHEEALLLEKILA